MLREPSPPSPRRVTVGVLAAALCWATCAIGPSAAAGATPLPGALAARCPDLAPEILPGDALHAAAGAAVKQAPAIYKGLDLRGRRATRVVLAARDRDRGGFARKCGTTVRARTVVVYLEFPALKPSSSLSQGVVLVSRFHGAYRVWAVLH